MVETEVRGVEADPNGARSWGEIIAEFFLYFAYKRLIYLFRYDHLIQSYLFQQGILQDLLDVAVP